MTCTNKVAFCTTALRNFWDISKPLVLFGEGCVIYSDEDTLQNFRHDILEDPLSDPVRLREAQFRVDKTFETLLGLLTDALNSLHAQNMSSRYWQILLGIWLHYYLASLSDRWCCTLAALDKFPKGSTIGLVKESFQTPRDTIHHAELLKGDCYNLQLYTRILEFLGVPFTSHQRVFDDKPRENFSTRKSLFKLTKTKFRHTIDWLTRKANPAVFVKETYLSPRQEIELFLRSKGLIAPIFKLSKKLPEKQVDLEFRANLSNLLPTAKDFEGAALKFLSEEIPKCFIENYQTLKKIVDSDFPKHSKMILSANSCWYDEPFKEWAARCAENDTMIVGHQHGGNYGLLNWDPEEEYEISISDRYYTWGWDKPKEELNKVVPFFATKLTAHKKKSYSHKDRDASYGILMTLTSEPRFALSLNFRPSQMHRYLCRLRVFIVTLKEEARSCLTIRMHPEEHGWQIANRLNDIHANFDSNLKMSFLKGLESCSLFVSDHLSTTWLESLAFGKPSIFFFDPKGILLREEAIPYLEQLKRVGVLFHDPIEAANAVNLIVDDPESWWMDPARQDAVRHFTERFVRASKDAVKLWAKELISLTRDEH